jgi:hypothetical protein
MESLTNPRFLRGVDIARGGGVRSLRRQVWAVNSATHTGSYLVDLAAEIPACTCPDFEEHGELETFKCKHVFAVMVHAKKIEVPAGLTVVADIQARRTYAQNWPAYEAAQQHEREHFESLLRDLCGGIVNPVQALGRPRKPLADIVFAAVLRSYTGMSSRRATSDVRAAHEAGLIDEMISSKTLVRFRNFDAIESIGAVPYVPFKIGTTGEGPALWRKMFGLYTYKNDEFRRHYHARSNVETAFSMVKRKFGASLRAKNETAQHNETLCKLLAHNLCVLVASMYELNVAAEFWGQSTREVSHVG